ncbi:MFS transporter [Leptolyngbya sp. FACHB-321]|uniref:MFS transporter n=1 Tax=Leptolyngbya sp. FACHB-321 TaxID=2692807 RepID=UPI001681DE85|nr:MFS transporter [Leptolyngbya sp. FACHB-321]MBD2037685.1 MFS transporter [Leptolyngbya sp. FACHB-321]
MQKTYVSRSSKTYQFLALVLLCAAQFMIVLDFSIVNVALPSIQQSLGFSPQQLQWVVSAYSLTFGGFLLLGGRAADLFGRRRLLLLGLGVFTLASLVGGFSPSQVALIAARAFQGLGAALVAPAILAIVLSTLQENAKRSRALGALGAMAAGGFAAGVLLGGLLTDSLSWRWVMFVNVSIGLALMVGTPFLLQESRAATVKRQIDLAGTVVVMLGLMLLVYTLVQIPEVGWASPATALKGMGAIALFALFIWIESQVSVPLVPLHIFAQRSLMAASQVAAFVSAIGASMVFILTLYMQQILHYTAFQTGIAFLPHAVAAIVAAPLSSHLVHRTTVKFTLMIGLILSMIGLLQLTALSTNGIFVHDLLPGTVLVGLGIVTCFVTVTILATTGVEGHEQGLVSGLLNTFQQIGSAVGLATVMAIATARTNSLSAGANVPSENLLSAATEGFQSALFASAGFAALGVILQE